MLNKIRKGADSFFVRLILGLIAFSFVGIGGVSFMKGNSMGDAVTFSDADPISVEKFMRVKAQEIDAIQRENGIDLTEEQIAQLGIDNGILQRLINESMIAWLAKYYDFDISDDQIIKVVRQSPYFKNEAGNFDLNIFKATFKNSKQREEEYLENLKSRLIKGTMINVFMDSYIPPKIMTDNIVAYMAENRTVDIFEIKLNNIPKDWKASEPEELIVKDFYEANKTDFITPELRSFNYIKASSKFLSKSLQISDEEIKQYYEENKEEFPAKNFASVKSEVKTMLKKVKLDELLAELSKNFGDDIAGGLSLAEIAEKYELEINSVENISKDSMSASNEDEIVELTNNVFEMIEGELSYPIELQEQGEILIVELKSISPAKQQALEEVASSIKEILKNKQLANNNIKILDKLKSEYTNSGSAAKLKSDGVTIVNASFLRAELQTESNYPPALLAAIFQTPANTSTPVIKTDNKAYFAFVRTIKTDSKKAAKISKGSLDHISSTIREGMMHEIIGHLVRKNNTQIKL
jgi:hypothetical protein